MCSISPQYNVILLSSSGMQRPKAIGVKSYNCVMKNEWKTICSSEYWGHIEAAITNRQLRFEVDCLVTEMNKDLHYCWNILCRAEKELCKSSWLRTIKSIYITAVGGMEEGNTTCSTFEMRETLLTVISHLAQNSS